ncbi:MAG: DUF302 domain-containing protein [Rhodospirillaceae bacterium]
MLTLIAVLTAVAFSTQSMAANMVGKPLPNGLILIKSDFSPKETLDRLANILKSKNIQVVARVDHAAAAKKAGADLPPTELLIFGNPKTGTPLMQGKRTIGIDLPLTALGWQTKEGSWIAYNAPKWLEERHQTGKTENIAKMAVAMNKMVAAAAKK